MEESVREVEVKILEESAEENDVWKWRENAGEEEERILKGGEGIYEGKRKC